LPPVRTRHESVRRSTLGVSAFSAFSAFLVFGTLVVTLTGGPTFAGTSDRDAAAPTVTGPVAGAPTIVSSSFDLAPFGYVQEEYFFGGDARAYTSTTPLTEDGRWTAEPASTAPFTTRMLVIRPADRKDFNGTVFVEWLNVTAGFDTAPGWSHAHLEMLREGAAWVGVSAQAVGVQGGQAAIAGAASGGIKAGDPARYGSLTHPGDSYSYDIFTQAARALEGEGGAAPLGPLRPKRIIATGESQSASRLVTYIDAVHPLVRVYDGFLVHSRFGGAAALSQQPLADVPAPIPARIRTDLREPVFVFETESDVGPLGFAVARQPDTKRIRTWEVAGTAHADVYTTLGFGDTGDGAAEVTLLDYTNLSYGALNCTTPVNAGPQYAVLMAALQHLARWARDGTPPPRGEPLTVTEGPGRTVGGRTVPSYVITRDEYGNAIGGIRSPLVDAPRAALTGETNSGGTLCGLFGITSPFDASTIAELYPSRDAFLREFRRAAAQSVEAGFLLPEEAKKLRAAASIVPYGGAG
jgi:hypothetical protein